LYTCRSEIFSNSATSTTSRARLFCSKESARPTLSVPCSDPTRSGSRPDWSCSKVPPRRELMIAVLPCSFTPSSAPLHGIRADVDRGEAFYRLPYIYSMLASKRFESSTRPTFPTANSFFRWRRKWHSGTPAPPYLPFSIRLRAPARSLD
jgi:hypothetical protein